MRTLKLMSPLALLVVASVFLNAADSYRLIQRVAVPGESDWDYLALDSGARRLYVSHGSEVVVINTDTNTIGGRIPVTKGAHGIAIATEFGKGFISKTDPGSVTVFDLKSLRPLQDIRVGDDPNCILYDSATKRVFTADRGSKQVSAIDARSGKVVGAIGPLDGKVEYAVSDGVGHVLINLQDRNVLLQLDANALTVIHAWPVAPCVQPTSMAIDRASKRVFIGCRSGVIAVVDASSGHVVTTLPIGKGVDATAYDETSHSVFASNGDGTMTVISQETSDRYRVVENVKTETGARTMAFDPLSQRAFLAAPNHDKGLNVLIFGIGQAAK